MALQKMSSNNSKKTLLKKLEYPEKILIILREAIGGNQELRDFLFKSQYKELGFFCYALLNDVKSRKWLLENQFAHLLATIEGIEGKESACLLYTSPSPRDFAISRMPSSA